MIVAVVLVLATLVARALGLAGIGYFDGWPAAVRAGLAVMLLFASSAHFNLMQADLVRMVPVWIPRPRAMVILTGVLEWCGAVGLLISATQRCAGWALIALFVALLPANIHAARSQVTLRGKPATALQWRVPLQLLFIALTWWSACLSWEKSFSAA